MKKILINQSPWQTRVAIIDDSNNLQNIYFWSHAGNHLERCFFKGLVTKVLPGIQTAFVEINQEKAGFLHISEIDRELAGTRLTGSLDQDDDAKPKRSRGPADISKILKEQECVLVQVSKEPMGSKGAKLSTCFTLPGRFIVLMPNIPRIGTSRKIETHEERHRLKDLVKASLPEGMGAIIRTCSENRTERELKQDIAFLLKTWNEIIAAEKKAEAGAKIYQDINLAFQVIRDHLDEEVESVLVDEKASQKELTKYVKEIAPEYSSKIKMYTGKTPLFERYHIEEQIHEAIKPKAELKSGGSIVIETTEAMTVVDVNTGRFVGKNNLEDTILKTNLEAAEEVVRQLKIRNIGGLIVIDFIDMASAANRRKLIQKFEKTLKEQDKFQSVVLQISEFGLVQMTRKRSGKMLQRELTDACKICKGSGLTASVQAESYNVLRNIRKQLESGRTKEAITIKLSPEVFDYISTTEYNTLFNFEKEYSCKVTLESDKTLTIPQFKIETK
jgi:ribonuclease G